MGNLAHDTDEGDGKVMSGSTGRLRGEKELYLATECVAGKDNTAIHKPLECWVRMTGRGAAL